MMLARIVDTVERGLAEFYGFAPLSTESAHLVTRDELRASLGGAVESLPEYRARAGVFLVEQTPDTFIGIHFDESLRATLEARDPTRELSDANLDAFCILVEEVSHFHLLLNRLAPGRGVSKLELETQGEIDKLLVCALLLGHQAGDQHLVPLARRLYDTAVITGEDKELYWQATRHAARFWFEAIRREARLGPRLRESLRQIYAASWAEKQAKLVA